MEYNELIDHLMPLVDEASKLPCVIWKSSNGWRLDYISVSEDKADIYYENIKLIDPFALSVKGSDFSRGSYPYVFDEVLKLRLRAEYNALGDRQTEELHSLVNFLEDNMSGLSGEAAFYIAELDNPLVELNKVYLECLKDRNNYGKMGDTLIEQLEMIADPKAKATITALIITGGINNSVYVTFPASAEDLNAVKTSGSIEDCRVMGITCHKMPILPRFLGNHNDIATVSELQYVAEIISTLTQSERDTVSAYLEMKLKLTAELFKEDKPIDDLSVKHVMEALENRDVIMLDTSVKNAVDIGNQRLNAALENCQPAIDRLTASNDKSDKSFMEFINILHENFNVAEYGSKLCEQNDIYITSKGAVSVDRSAFMYRNDREIPEKMADYAEPGNIKPSILKTVEDNKNKISHNDKPTKHKKQESNLE